MPTLDELIGDAAAIAACAVGRHRADYIVDIVRATREHPVAHLRRVAARRRHAGLGGRACARRLRGRDFVIPDDVKALAPPRSATASVCRPTPRSRGLDADNDRAEILEQVPAPR